MDLSWTYVSLAYFEVFPSFRIIVGGDRMGRINVVSGKDQNAMKAKKNPFYFNI